MAPFTLAYRPKVGEPQGKAAKSVRPEPGSNLNKAIKDPKVTKPSPKTTRTDEVVGSKVVKLTETTRKLAELSLGTVSIAPKAKKRQDNRLWAYMPKVGMVYMLHKRYKTILSAFPGKDTKVLRGLWAQQETTDKRELQALIAPIFRQAAFKIKADSAQRTPYQGGDSPEDDYTYEEPRTEEIKRFWDTFQVDLRDQFPRTSWPHKMSKARFVDFFSALADARFCGRSSTDGREHPELVRAITEFLDAADYSGNSWSLRYADGDDDDEDGDDKEDEDDAEDEGVY